MELYIKLGKRVRATIQQLGYPTKNTLKGWYREYAQGQDLARGYQRAGKFSPEQQRASVDHYIEHGRCISATRKALGYPCRALLEQWVYERHPELFRQSVGRSYPAPEGAQD